MGFHKFFPCFDFGEIVGYPNEIPLTWRMNIPKFDDDFFHAAQHIMSFMEYVVKLDVIHEDIWIILFFISLDGRQKAWVRNCIAPKTISSYADFLKIFFKNWGPPLQRYEDVFGSIIAALQEYEQDKIIETIEDHEIKQTTYNPMESQSLEKGVGEEYSYGPPKEQKSPCEHIEENPSTNEEQKNRWET
jgi:hypothetical protein